VTLRRFTGPRVLASLESFPVRALGELPCRDSDGLHHSVVEGRPSTRTIDGMGGESLSQLWTLARQDAGFDPGTEVRLYPLSGTPPANGRRAMHLEPGSEVVWEPDVTLTRNQIADANRPDVIGLHRIAVFDNQAPPVLLGLLRHELQHARQWQDDRAAYQAGELLVDMLGRVAAYTSAGIGASSLYNVLPLERDANAAASTLLREHFGEVSDRKLVAEHGQILDFDPSWALTEPLGTHTMEAAALHPDEFEDACRHGGRDLDATLSALHPDGPVLWKGLKANDVLNAKRAAFPAQVPDPAEIAAAGEKPGAAWRPLHNAFLEAMAVARALIQQG
jgi:hypothetical protein